MGATPQFAHETQALRHVLKRPDHEFRWSKHALGQMRDRKVTESDVRRVFRLGRVTFVEQKKDELWHVEGRDVDGRSIRIVAHLMEAQLVIKVITVVTP